MSPNRPGRTLPLTLLVLGIVVAAGVAVYFFSQSTLQVSRSSRALADEEMNAVRRQFGPAQPCLERPGDKSPSAPTAPIHSVHLLAWSPGERLVRASTPFWALRAGAWKVKWVRPALPILDYVTLADVEKCGTGVLIDRATSSSGRVLIWVD